MQKIYIDTNILISYISGPEKESNQFSKAKQIFDDIKQGKFIGVISMLTLIEIKGVLRTILGSDRTQLQTIPENKQADHVKTKATEIFQALISELLQLSSIKFEKGRQTNFQLILDLANGIMDDIKGTIRFYNTCGNCNAPYKSSKHKQILAADILHALLAKDTACDSLITFDKGFNALVGNQHIDPLQIQVQ